MPIFGQHETAQRLDKSGVGTLFTLSGGADTTKVLKILQPLSGLWSERHLREEVDAFLLRLKTQQLLAKSSSHWAPVHEVKAFTTAPPSPSETPGVAGKPIGKRGTTVGTRAARNLVPAGAYAVLDRYDRSVHSLIDSRVRVTNNDLRNLFGTTFRALVDLKNTLHRPHGNLKSTNILLKNSADLGTATVHLSDPAADGSLTPTSAKKDLADLAKILFELVNLHPYTGGTIGPNQEWSALGPNGEDWRKLCNALLDPGAPADERDPEKIIPRIETWILQPKKSKAPLIAAAVFGVLIAGGIGAYFLTRPPRLNYDQAAWEKLCLVHYAWFGDFLDSMSEDQKKKLSQPPYPSEIVKLLNDAHRELPYYSPQAIAKQGQSAKVLAASPTDDARTGSGPYYTKQGGELADHIADALSPTHWPLLGTLDSTAATWEKRGWYLAAGGVRNVIAGARPPAIPTTPIDPAERAKAVRPVDILANIDRTITAASTVEQVAQVFSTLSTEIKQLPAADVPLIKDLPKFAEDLPRTGSPPPATTQGAIERLPGTLDDVKKLAAQFATIKKVVDDLGRDLKANIDFAELAKDPAAQEPAEGKLTVVSYTTFAKVLPDYRKLPADPRAAVKWEDTLATVQTTMIDVITKANPADTHLAALTAHLQKVQQEYGTLKTIAPIEKNNTTLVSLVKSTKDDLDKLTDEGNEFVSPYIVHPTEFIALQRARLTNDPLLQATPVVRDQWVKADTAFLEKVAVESAGLQVYNYSKYQDYVRKFKAIEETYAAFDKKIPAAVEGLSSIQGTDWKHAIAAKVAGPDRSAALSDLMTNPALKWSDDLPQVDEAGYQSFQRERLATYDRLRTDAISLLADYSTIEARLNNLDLLPNEPAPNAPTWRTLATKWKSAQSPLLTDTDITAALAPLNTRVANLLALDPLTDYSALKPRTTDPAPEVALTSWRKVGSASVNETLPVLADEDTAETHLQTLLATSSKAGTLDNAKAAALAAEIKAARPTRWRHWTSTLTSVAPIQTALTQRAAFNVTLDPQKDATLVFDDALFALRKQSDANLKEAELKKVAQSFVSSVNAMPAAVKNAKPITDLLAVINKPLQHSEEESSTVGAGPKLAGWEQDPSPNASLRVFYYTNPKTGTKYTLAFDRVTVGTKTIYLATTEMPFSLFAELANTPQHFADLANSGKPSDKQHWFAAGDWQGPRVWSIDSGSFVLNPQWIEPKPTTTGISIYPPNQTPAAPSADQPMQQLSIWSAQYISRLLGCRLPTSDEWKAAYDKFEATGPVASAWNLRGTAWQAEQDFAKRLIAGGNADMTYPDNGMFNTPDNMFAGITADAATPWHNDGIAKLAPARAPADSTVYPGSQLWFRKVGAQPGVSPATAGGMHDLVGNVAEYTLDGPTTNAVIKDARPTPDTINALIAANAKGLSIIGGSSLSPPQLPFNQPQLLDLDNISQATTGFSDVGFRLAYTAPIDSINDVLASLFKDNHYLAPGNAK